LGLHWALLQAVAWTGMIVSYSHNASLAEAVSKTFDGAHPCCLCQTIKQGRAEEKQQESIAPATKLPPAILWQAPLFSFTSDQAMISAPDQAADPRAEAPPKPRPRSAADHPLA
jgi:hypothetical protein